MSDYAYVEAHYLPLVEPTREQVRSDPELGLLLSDELDAREQLGALIEFCAVGVRLLRPVEGLLRRAAASCGESGFDSLGADFDRLSRDAISRRLRLIDDFVQLAAMWSERFGPPLCLASLVRRPLGDAAARQSAVREAAAGEPLPFGLIGVELELGELAVWMGPQLLRASERKLGSEVLGCLTYLQARTEHAALRGDDLLERLDDLLHAVPEIAQPCAAVGIEALLAQRTVFSMCVEHGRRLGTQRLSMASVAQL